MATSLKIRTARGLRGTTGIPGDKSISHRAVMLGGIASGESRVSNFLMGTDCLATIGVMRALGVLIEVDGDRAFMNGRGLRGLVAPKEPLDCDNSGTTMRLLSGLLAGQKFPSELVGTAQLMGRPMNRVAAPLCEMGARIETTDGHAPIRIQGNGDGATLIGMRHEMTVASAQVKSAILLAGLFAPARTTIVERGPTRDHTERMLSAMGAVVRSEDGVVTIEAGTEKLNPLDIKVPGDISSAAFLLVAGSIVPGSEITVEGVGMNPTRTGIVTALKKMGADIEILNPTHLAGEPVADLTVRTAALQGAEFGGDEIVTMIDELQVLAVAATLASGTTTIRGAKELRVKETDRIATTATELRAMGAEIEELPDGMVIHGVTALRGADVTSHGDHRAALLLAVAGMIAEGTTVIADSQVTEDSFPRFSECMRSLGAEIEEVAQ